MSINKRHNGYAATVSFYEECPKAVFAALAVSLSHALEHDESPSRLLAQEWQILHNNGIVPQPPPRHVRLCASDKEADV